MRFFWVFNRYAWTCIQCLCWFFNLESTYGSFRIFISKTQRLCLANCFWHFPVRHVEQTERMFLFYPQFDERLDKAFNCQDAHPALYATKGGEWTFILNGDSVYGDDRQADCDWYSTHTPFINSFICSFNSLFAALCFLARLFFCLLIHLFPVCFIVNSFICLSVLKQH